MAQNEGDNDRDFLTSTWKMSPIKNQKCKVSKE
jgi:hypothetical protein